MCGRYALRNPRGHDWLAAASDDLGAPRYNIAPGQPITVVARDRSGARVVRAVNWGFRPHWWQEARRAPINARAEGVADRPLFRRAFAHGRCLVPADGWYEWQASESGPKRPYFFHRPDDAVFWFAAIAARDAQDRPNAAIITRAAASGFAGIHERMPAVLTDDDAAATWIDPATDRDRLLALLLAGDDDMGIVTHAVGRAVNRPENDGPELVASVDEA